ncbi:energy transducer TonB [Thiobaca trueperi]|uniref:Protein TonB n=1 Tax=Thiobaca trueperi TaxID=127458 RepID=A0A4R3MTJ2_9GAMM|nr:energy transducer TonB [Thiobaca trueperi]TCT19760.1 outer membrane transport energization protein TonB [Thiobaca trueperi]
MTRVVAPLPSVPLWLAASIAVMAEGALLAGLAIWSPSPEFSSPSTLIEVSLVSLPSLAESAATTDGLASVADPEPEPASAPVATPPPVPEPVAPAPPEPAPPVAVPEPAPKPVVAPELKPQPKPKPKQAAKPQTKPQPASPPRPAPSAQTTRRLARTDQGAANNAPSARRENGTERTAGKGSAGAAASSPVAYLNNPPPDYPGTARRLRQEGTVHLRVLVGAGGQPGEVRLDGSSGVTSLDQAAIRGVKRWRFKPAHRNGQPLAAWVRIPIHFKLKSP